MAEPLTPDRPRFLMVIGTLSVINGIYGMVSSVVNAIAPVDIDQRRLDDLFTRLEELNLPFEHFRADLEVYFFNTVMQMGNIAAASFLFYGVSFIGAFLMLRLRRVGFVLYLVAQAGLAFVPSFFGGFNAFGWAAFGVAGTWNAVWVITYATQLKHLRA